MAIKATKTKKASKATTSKKSSKTTSTSKASTKTKKTTGTKKMTNKTPKVTQSKYPELNLTGAVVVRIPDDAVKIFADFADTYVIPSLRDNDPEKTPVAVELLTSVGRDVLGGSDEEFDRVCPFLARKTEHPWSYVGMDIHTDPTTNKEYYRFLFDFASLKELVNGIHDGELDE